MKGIMMYTGNEKLEYKGKELPYSMLQFWQLSLSDILFNMNRGTFAEYIVRCALIEGGFIPPDESTLPDSKLVFSIKPAIDWDTNEKGRHNDLYVFCHYKATSKAQNILDMGLWDFYVYPTFKIDSDLKLKEKNSISLYRIKKLGVMQVSFDALNDEIVRQISIVSEHLSRSEETA